MIVKSSRTFVLISIIFPVPSLWIGAVEASLRWWFPDGRFSLVMDLCNDLKFIFIFVLGFGITAADEHGMEQVVRRGRWHYLAAGDCVMIKTNPDRRRHLVSAAGCSIILLGTKTTWSEITLTLHFVKRWR